MSTRPRSTTPRALATVFAALVTALALLAGLVALDASPASAATTIYVAPTGSDSNAGTEAAPYRTIKRAVQVAQSGDTIILRGGVYRESVQIYGKALRIESAPGERAVMEGARAVTGFVASDGDWYAGGWTTEFRTTSGPFLHPDRPEAAYPDQVFLDGTPQKQVLSRSEVVPGTFYHDTAADRLWLGSDPTGRLVEASDLSYGLYFNNADGSRLTNVTVRRYATERADWAAVRVHSDNVVLDGVTVELNAFNGLSVMGEVIIVRNSKFSDNGYSGIVGHLSKTVVIERSAIVGNNKEKFDAHHSAAGVKITTSEGLTFRENDVSRNDGPGIWTDLDVKYVTVVGNLTERNGRSGIELELSSYVNAIGNVSQGNGETGIWVLESQHVSVYHNALYRNRRDIWVEEGPRAEVDTVRIRNNVFGEGRDRSPALFNVDDWTEERSAEDMKVLSDYNAFWLPPGSPTSNISRWARWPQSLAYATTLDQHRANTGQDINSVWSTAATNPYVRDAASGDYRTPPGTKLGVPVYGSMATQLGVPSGTRLPIGPHQGVTVRR